MGFETTLMIVQKRICTITDGPPAIPPTGWKRTVLARFHLWTPIGLVRIGHTSEVAAQPAVEAFFQRLLNIGERGHPSDFAPPFLMKEEKVEEELWMSNAASILEYQFKHGLIRDGAEFVLQQRYTYDDLWQMPSDQDAEKHNKICALSSSEFRAGVHNSRFCPGISKAPMVWQPCLEVAKWFEETEETSTPWSKALHIDKDALAVYRARLNYLREMAASDARAVFIFDGSPFYADII